MDITKSRWRQRLPRRLRWSTAFVVGAAVQWLVGKGLDWAQPNVPTALLNAMQWFLELLPPTALLLLALGAALPYLAEKVPAMRELAAHWWRNFIRPWNASPSPTIVDKVG